jgi:hypothetical protein
MSDPVSRLQLSRQEIDGVFGEGYAAAHPELVAVVSGVGGLRLRRAPYRPGRCRTSPPRCGSRCRSHPSLFSLPVSPAGIVPTQNARV